MFPLNPLCLSSHEGRRGRAMTEEHFHLRKANRTGAWPTSTQHEKALACSSCSLKPSLMLSWIPPGRKKPSIQPLFTHSHLRRHTRSQFLPPKEFSPRQNFPSKVVTGEIVTDRSWEELRWLQWPNTPTEYPLLAWEKFSSQMFSWFGGLVDLCNFEFENFERLSKSSSAVIPPTQFVMADK